MTGFAKLFRTTAFRLAVFYLVIFSLFASVMLGYVAWNARRLFESQLTETIQTEVLSLSEQYRIGGARRLASTIERRSRQARGFLYLFIDARGDVLAGNATELLKNMHSTAGWHEFSFPRSEEADGDIVLAKVQLHALPNGFRLMVGHDLEDRRRLRTVIRQAFGWSMMLVLLLGGLGAWIVTRRVLRPVESMTDVAERIMGGNLHERLPVSGVGDEFDRLSDSVNRMLNRINELMAGLREVSDNIAHDLRTPLTRLRSGAEEALRTARSKEELTQALERTIEESDNLIKIFNALLMIARAEAGSVPGTMGAVDLSKIVYDVCELYEPAAEDAGQRLKVCQNDPLTVFGNRELLGQALANLIDNAIKYAPKGAEDRAVVEISLTKQETQAVVMIRDYGEGIPDGDLSRVLERFVRLEKSRVKVGSGLGLSLVAAVAQVHCGKLCLENAQPGLRATLTLPIMQDKHEEMTHEYGIGGAGATGAESLQSGQSADRGSV